MGKLEEAKQIIEAEKQERSKKCVEKIEAILKEFNCSITTNAICVVNGVQIMPQIVSN